MAATLSPTRNQVTPRHAFLGFTVQTGVPGPAWFEVVLVTDPGLLDANARARRTSNTFARSGWQHAEHGEAVYVVPPSLLERFEGKERLYYAISVANGPDDPNPRVTRLPAEMLPYVKLAPDMAVGLRRVRGYTNVRGGLTGEGAYGVTAHSGQDALTWAGDTAAPGAMEPAATNGHATAAPSLAPAPGLATPATPVHAAAAALELPYRYDDGYPDPDALAYAAAVSNGGASVMHDNRYQTNGHADRTGASTTTHPGRLPARPRSRAQETFTDGDDTDDADGYGITGAEPSDDDATAGRLATASAIAMDAPVQVVPPPYPGATFDSAASVNYRRATHPRTVNRIVIHITDGGSDYRGTVAWFKNPNQLNSRGEPIHVSAHYVVGQGGQIVQMVPHADIAWHASQANRNSIGIEHTARSGRNQLLPTEAEYHASACLVRWLCQQYGFPADREHIVGHYEISPRDNHPDCPTGAWDWDHYMDLVTNADCATAAVAQGLRYAPRARGLGQDAFSINWDDVDMIGQPTSVTCWATAGALVLGWRDRVSMSVEYVASVGGRSRDRGLAVNDTRQFAEDVGLVAESPQSYSVEGLRHLLENYGPLWVGITPEGGGGHAIVVTGMYSDGNPDGSGTYIRVTDPWDRVVGTPGNPGGYMATHISGSRYILTWDTFMTEYETRISSSGGTVNIQILHCASAFSRQPNPTGAAGYAQSLADSGTSNTPVLAPTPARRLVGRSQQAPSIDWDLEQFDGLVSPNPNSPAAVTEVFQDAPPIVLDDWPFMAAPRDDTGRRLQAACQVYWQYSGRAVGHVRIEPGTLQELPGYTLAVRASVAPDQPAQVGTDQQVGSLQVLLHYQFTRPDATVAHASTSLRLYGNGAYDRSGAWQ